MTNPYIQSKNSPAQLNKMKIAFSLLELETLNSILNKKEKAHFENTVDLELSVKVKSALLQLRRQIEQEEEQQALMELRKQMEEQK